MPSKNGLLMKYFVLSPTKDSLFGEASRLAIRVFAGKIAAEYPQLSVDLLLWVEEIEHGIRTKAHPEWREPLP